MTHQSLRNYFLVLFIFLGSTNLVQARHIIGGNIYYQYLGDQTYEFTLNIYRDCTCSECAQLDNTASIGIYRCTGRDCNDETQGTPWGVLAVPLSEQRFIDAPDYPCVIEPDNLCVEEGTYRFTIQLPLSEDTYHISYQRCCRNVTINNIVSPELQGSTYTIEIDSFAQRQNNNTPTFNTFPPTVICANSPLVFDHSATDPDGDQLVYEFCSPLLGGGNTRVQAQARTCIGPIPTPACPPPYVPVPFLPPLYSAENPMSGRPIVKIDPNTGLITGTPEAQGQFVVGVCVSEYRNGELLSRVFRDFQFNVTSCDPEVVADLREDIRLDDQYYGVNSCGSTEVTFENQSYQRQFIDEHFWSFEINGEIQTFDAWSPTVTFPGIGQYNGSLVLNPGTECGDTALILVNVYPDLEADFSYEYDTCIAGDVVFTDLSTTQAKYLTEWDWRFGDGEFSKEQNPVHLYRDPGQIPVTLSIKDTNQCTEQVTKTINYFPVPALIVVSPSTFDGCSPVDVFFDNLSFPIDETYDIRWNFGEGGTSNEISPTYTYNDIGVFTVDLSITSPIGCETDTIFPDLISVLESPKAGFDISPEEPTILDPEIFFSDASEKAARILWDFGDGRNSLQYGNVAHTYRDTGRYEVRQIVTHQNGCIDTLIRFVDIKPEVRYFLPNAFTPNNDGLNDIYMGVGFMAGARNFTMTIWNRWGEQIFESTNPQVGWDGKTKMNQEAPNGVYVVKVSFEGPRGDQFEYKTFATLLR